MSERDPDWKTIAIVLGGTTVVAAWLFYGGLQWIGAGRSVLGTVALVVALLLIAGAHLYLARGRYERDDAGERRGRFPWYW